MKLILLGHRPLEMKQMINTTLLKKHLVHAVCRVLFWVIEYKDKVSALKVFQFSSVQFSHSVISDSMWPHEPQHARPPCPSPTSEVHSDSCPLSQWCHLIISFCRLLLLLPSIFPNIRVFSSESALRIRWPSTRVSASTSVLAMNTQDWFPLGWSGWISLQSKGLSGVFSNTTVQKHQFFGAQPSSQSNSHIHTWPQEKP